MISLSGNWVALVLSCCGFALAGFSTFAANPAIPPGVITLRSKSDQFIVQGPARSSVPRTSLTETNRTRLWLTPQVLTVSCERVKEAFLLELDLRDRWRGKVHVALVPAVHDEQAAGTSAALFNTGYQYRIEVPERITMERLVRGLTSVLLQELVNRNSQARPAEIPLWLTEGLTRQIMFSNGPELVVEAPDSVQVSGNAWRIGVLLDERRKGDPLKTARDYLVSNPFLTFTEMSLPTANQLSGPGWLGYQFSAQVFFASLLKLEGGPKAMQDFIQQMPGHLNWQTAFQKAFSAHFPRLLDVEKWWAVTVMNFVGRNERLSMSREECLKKLDEILPTPVQIRLSTSAVPARSQLTPQQVIEEWDFSRQKVALNAKVNQLTAISPNSPPDLMPLVVEYRDTLLNYLRSRDRGGPAIPVRGQPAFSPQLLARTTIARLHLLDRELAKIRELARAEALVNPPN